MFSDLDDVVYIDVVNLGNWGFGSIMVDYGVKREKK